MSKKKSVKDGKYEGRWGNWQVFFEYEGELIRGRAPKVMRDMQVAAMITIKNNVVVNVESLSDAKGRPDTVEELEATE